MRELQKILAFISLGTAFEIVGSFVSTKVISVLLGPPGVGALGQITNFYSLAVTLAEIGFLLGTARYVAEARERHDQKQLGAVIATSFLFTSLTVIVVIALSFLFSDNLSMWVLGDRSLAHLIWLSAPGILFLSFFRKVDRYWPRAP